METIWIEKYRPSSIDSILQSDIKQLIFQKHNLINLPHLLFYGQPGTGKTTTALIICKYLFNSNNILNKKKIMNERVLELNASDDRGINVVREKIKIFAAQALNNYKDIPNFKIIILDEADAMTNDSQFALRRIIEQYSHITRFILICNYVTKIITPLVSRCSKYRFNNINIIQMKCIIQTILTNEQISYNIEYLDNINNIIYNITKGDLRKTITILQRSIYISKLNKIDINSEIINEIGGIIPLNNIINLYNVIKNKIETHKDITTILTHLINCSYSITSIINEISILILNDNDITDIQKSKIFIKMSNICNLLANSSGDYIQLLALCSYINHILANCS